jgi:hypothetical protein
MTAEVMAWVRDHAQLFQQLGVLSLLLLVVTLVALPLVVVMLPEDYFVREKRNLASRRRKHPVFWGVLSVFKNLVGLVLVLAGVVMLVLPGQGLVTILVGLAMTNFPGKYAIERRIAGRPAVGTTLNAIRRFGGRPPLLLPGVGDDRSPRDG